MLPPGEGRKGMNKLGIIAGIDYLPVEVAKAAKKEGQEVVVISVTPQYAEELPEVADQFHQTSVGQLTEIVNILKNEQVSQVVMAGKVTKEVLFANLVLDERAKALLFRLKDKNDDSILLALVEELAQEGLEVLSQTSYLEKFLPKVGVLSSREPTSQEWLDIKYGQEMAKRVAGLDIGQTIVVKNQAILAVEAIEGTDAAIARGGSLGRGNSVVIKVSKPQQDLRFDMPTVGLNTLQSMLKGNCSVLAIEAEKTFLLQKEELLQMANQAGLAVVAFEV